MRILSFRSSSSSGFTLPEAVLAIFLTLIIMVSAFGMLAQGTRSSTVEMERADLQAQTRQALSQISRDLILAGYGMPPEFPSLGSGSTSGIRATTSQRLEILGNMAADDMGMGRVEVESFDGVTARLGQPVTGLAPGQPVLFYDDLPIDGRWVLGLIDQVRPEVFEVDIVTGAGASVSTRDGGVSLPMDVDRFNRTPNGPPSSGFMTPVTIVSYELEQGVGDSMPVLVRQLNWGDRVQLAHVESMEIRYFVGATITGPVIQNTSPRPDRVAPYFQKAQGASDQEPGQTAPSGQTAPPQPQPDPSLPLDDSNVVSAVRISLTGRSQRENLVGSRLKPDENATEGGYLRQTFSTRVATRNLLSQAERRKLETKIDAGDTQY